MTEVNQPIHNDEQYFEAINRLIKPLSLSVKINNHENVSEVLKLIQTSDTKETVSVSVSYNNLINGLKVYISSIKAIQDLYRKFYERHKNISADIDKMSKMQLRGLLAEGISLLESGNYKDESCPLCLQEKKREELIKELRNRIDELSAYEKELTEYNEEKDTIEKQLKNILSGIEGLFREKCIDIEADIKKELEKLKAEAAGNIERIKSLSIIEKTEPQQPGEFISENSEKLESIISVLNTKVKKLDEENKEDPRIKISVKIGLVRQAYTELQALKKKEDILNIQLKSMEVICEQFIKKQKESLNAFLNSISKDMNEYYLCMNQDERVDEIELIPIGEADELNGITIQYKFHGNIVSPPEKYLSESHLNCLGIALFLSSVRAFNRNNKFFVLDDVISSFDKPHRINFARLLLEKFKDYQILLFTHERDWFEILSGLVKPHNWIIKRVIWTDENGSEVDMALPELKERIEDKFSKSDTNDLGNMIRRYLERLLKEICCNLEVKLKFLFNDKNENRMSDELLSELVCKLKSRKCEIKDNAALNKLHQLLGVGNKTSHDNSYSEDINDLKTFYDDVLQFEKIFRCEKDNCGKLLSVKYLDTVKQLIRCSCGDLKYHWEE